MGFVTVSSSTTKATPPVNGLVSYLKRNAKGQAVGFDWSNIEMNLSSLNIQAINEIIANQADPTNPLFKGKDGKAVIAIQQWLTGDIFTGRTPLGGVPLFGLDIKRIVKRLYMSDDGIEQPGNAQLMIASLLKGATEPNFAYITGGYINKTTGKAVPEQQRTLSQGHMLFRNELKKLGIAVG